MTEQLCTFRVASPKTLRAMGPCGHTAEQHSVDDDGRRYCLPCWGSDDDELAYHTFQPAAVPA